MTMRYRLLRILADGRFHSGQDLGSLLGISRAAVWKHLKAIRGMGLDVQAVRGRGYRLAEPLELLDEARIIAAISQPMRDRLSALELHTELGSTNDRLRQRAREGAAGGTACLAERQTAGRGRRGRRWVSPFGSNLYLSLLWRFPCGPAQLGGLSLAVGVALMRSLRSLGVEGAGLKWPNDLICRQGKLAGVLVEMAGESAGPCSAVIGVGLNVRMPPDAASAIDQPWVDLHRLSHRPLSRNQVAGQILNDLIEVLVRYEQEGLAVFLDEWRDHDLVAGRAVQLHLPDAVLAGRASGIDDSGALLVQVDGQPRRFASGEVSLRMTP
ncbi:bifunctional biotin--[acetyl-CoA-carboxylase] ligase/biotin operon repressor BirA [Thiohalobacter sp. IOR34]|uniref:bifunctional biotin--[acetyl-CoA-carboxylase] ligase/biotin operon repressor BirA n=1 Tax=Thiohalobacter sp. IOR34 TaxID=3057176 RepID=UPI0025AF5C32|nr:bifunctional biotin--[acetyl-CoA-carboxylase] ligase/biotin operon repressor BirA [Thiohalobacter sp. IOR34]WJW75122.1 bifunctional biotin--[acetyl-CoA-carboxylase] ligase/biotin operon repressor BirA [Thiohalobacter sp. IOR34]